jgi:dimethylamine/trimethylamine dehydrogenase
MLRAHLHGAGVSVRHATTITGVGAGTVTGHGRHGEPWSAACDGVVLVTQQASQDTLYRKLAGDEAALAAAGIGGVYRIGGAVAPRMISEAIFDGHRLAREIDEKDPGQPAQYRRERADLA